MGFSVSAANVTGANAAPSAMIFVLDPDSEGIVRKSLADLSAAPVIFGSGGIAGAVKALGQTASPRLLVVDVSGIEDPIFAINELAKVCEPSTGVVVMGDRNDVRLYRNLKSAGVTEYFFKPLVGSLIAKSFSSILFGTQSDRSSQSGKLVMVMGVRGGTGATTVAAWSALELAEIGRRKVMLMDLDLHSGDAALQLNARPTHALREALEHPERVDDLFLERAVFSVTPRLGLLASLEPFDEVPNCSEDAVLSLLTTLMHRYRYVFVDIPATSASGLMRVLRLPSICVLVSDGGLVSAREVARWREIIGPNSVERSTTHVLNKSGAPGSLPLEEFVRAAGGAPDIVIPFSREVAIASTLGLTAKDAATAALDRAFSPVLRLIAGQIVPERKPFLSRMFG